MSATTPERKRLNLRCPYCQGRLSVMMEEAGSGYMSYNEPSGFECNNLPCGADWDIDGVLTHEPNWMRYPDLYQKPELPSEEADNG